MLVHLIRRYPRPTTPSNFPWPGLLVALLPFIVAVAVALFSEV